MAVVPRPEASLPLEVPESRSPADGDRNDKLEPPPASPGPSCSSASGALTCCGACAAAGQMRVLAFVTERPAIRKILDHLGLPSTGPPIARARRPAEFDFAG